MNYQAGTTASYAPFSVTIFISSFLLFLVQPIVGKFLLPHFGGSTSVWAVSLVFFTGVLFLGYTYVFLLSRFPVRTQAIIHSSLVAITIVASALSIMMRGTFFPSIDWTLDSSLPTALQVILALIQTIGLPYFVLSTSSPLIQQWFNAHHSKEPYKLYVISNIASFLALGVYPFLVEPAFTLFHQGQIWALLVIVCFSLHAFLAWKTLAIKARNEVGPLFPVTSVTSLIWLGLAALPAALLVATTSYITQMTIAVPLLWLVPLALYLLSFVIAFAGRGSGGLTSALVFAYSIAAYQYLTWTYASSSQQVLSFLGFFFFTALYCHAQLYVRRPPGSHSSYFYVVISLGGMIGTFVVSLLAPLIFTSVWEFPIGLALGALLSVGLFPVAKYIRDEYIKTGKRIQVAAILFTVIVAGLYIWNHQNSSYLMTRNFYGVVKITDWDGERIMYNGTTMHGFQYIAPEKQRMITTYYGPGSGAGRAIAYERAIGGKSPLSFGLIGLGTGTLTGYCRENDHFTVYEIDKRIENLAREYYSYLRYCPQTDVRIGDGRVRLESELRKGQIGKYNILLIDAFSDDTVPAHLLTKEAIQLYENHLADDSSLLAVHTSSRYFRLSPIIERIAKELGLFSKVVYDTPGKSEGFTASEWVLLARDKSILESTFFPASATSTPGALWTDDYINLWGVIALPSLF